MHMTGMRHKTTQYSTVSIPITAIHGMWLEAWQLHIVVPGPCDVCAPSEVQFRELTCSASFFSDDLRGGLLTQPIQCVHTHVHVGIGC